MSNFTRRTKHPYTGVWEDANWLDDYFGKHEYGIQFPSDLKVYRERELNVKQRCITLGNEGEWGNISYQINNLISDGYKVVSMIQTNETYPKTIVVVEKINDK